MTLAAKTIIEFPSVCIIIFLNSIVSICFYMVCHNSGVIRINPEISPFTCLCFAVFVLLALLTVTFSGFYYFSPKNSKAYHKTKVALIVSLVFLYRIYLFYFLPGRAIYFKEPVFLSTDINSATRPSRSSVTRRLSPSFASSSDRACSSPSMRSAEARSASSRSAS